MAFWLFMLTCAVITPVVMVFCGALYLRHPPRTPNAFYGYRTARSMHSTESWEFAQQHFGRLSLIYGAVSLPVCALPLLLVRHMGNTAVAVVGLCAAFFALGILLVSVFRTEAALRREFDR